MRETWKENFEEQYNVDAEYRVTVNMCDFDGARKGTYFIYLARK